MRFFKRLFPLFVLVCALTSFSVEARATNITITGIQFPSYQWGGTTGKVRAYASTDFTASNGTNVTRGTTGAINGFFTEANCTVASTTITCSSLVLPSTDDALDDRSARWSLVLFDSRNVRRETKADQWVLPVSSGTTITFAQWRVNQVGYTAPPREGSPTYSQMNAAIAAQVSVGNPAKPYASPTPLGRVSMSVAASDPALPIAVGDNDPRLPAQSENDALVGTSGLPSSSNKYVTNADPRANETFNVKTYGAVGEGVTDDTAAIQAAVTAANAIGAITRVVYLPGGTYKITAPIVTTVPILFRGAGSTFSANYSGTQITGNFADYLIRFDSLGIWPGGGVEDIYLTNTNAAGGGIRGEKLSSNARFEHLYINAFHGITLIANVFTIEVSDVALRWSGNTTGSWGLYSAGHTHLYSVDTSGFEQGLRLNGFGLSVNGGRHEVNKVGIMVAMTDTGAMGAVAGVDISGQWFEANDTAVQFTSGASAYELRTSRFHGSVNSPSGLSIYGVRSQAASTGSMRNLIVAGDYSQAAISVNSAVSFKSITVDNGTGKLWDVGNPQGCSFENTDYEPTGVSGTEAANVTASQFVRSIAAADQTRGMKAGKNLRGINLVVASGATSLDVTFPLLTGGGAAINTIAVSGAAHTLPTGTYYYIATFVNEIGETAATGERSIAVTLGQQVDITFFGVAGQKQWKRRIYRGTATGVYDGYFETALESSATFSDTGQAFTGKKSPSAGGTTNADGTEPDAVFAVVVAPAWDTTYWISNKATTGFRINFGTAPGSDSTLDWLIVR